MLFFFFSFQMLLGGGEASWEERRACSQPTTYRSYDQRLTLTAWNVTLTLGHYIDLYIRTTGAHVDRNKTLMADDSVTCIETLKITASKESFWFFFGGGGGQDKWYHHFFFSCGTMNHRQKWKIWRSWLDWGWQTILAVGKYATQATGNAFTAWTRCCVSQSLGRLYSEAFWRNFFLYTNLITVVKVACALKT